MLAKILKLKPAAKDSIEEPEERMIIAEMIPQLQNEQKSQIELAGLNSTLKTMLLQQDAHLQTFSEAFSELASSAEEISTTNQSVLSQSEKAAKEATVGSACVNQLAFVSSNLNKSKESLENLTATIRSMKESTLLINDIVFQTKLLSFNASIEATRAGEHGAGFSIVANQIRELAESSRLAADTIMGKIDVGIRFVDELVISLTSEINELAKTAQVTGKAFEVIDREVGSLTTAVREVSQGSLNQTTAIHLNHTTLNSMLAISQKNRTFFTHLDQIIEEFSGTTTSLLDGARQAAVNSAYYDQNDDQLQEAVRSTMLTIGKSRDFDTGLKAVILTICGHTEWKIAHVLKPDENGITKSANLWSGESAKIRSSEFYAMTSKGRFEPGKGLPGRVYQNKRFEWIEDVRVDSNFPRRDVAKKIDLVSGMGFPVLSRTGHVLAVVEFFSFSLTKVNPQLLNALNQLSHMLGLKVE